MLGLGVGVLGLAVVPAPARAVPVTVGGLSFAVPAEVSAAPPDPALGTGWQWQGRVRGGDAASQTVVLARADLASTDAAEILGLVLAGSTAGLLPDLDLTPTRLRPMPGGGGQTRIDLSYTAGQGVNYHGTLLMATRDEPPAALLVVVGGERLTAGTIDGVLQSARWLG